MKRKYQRRERRSVFHFPALLNFVTRGGLCTVHTRALSYLDFSCSCFLCKFSVKVAFILIEMPLWLFCSRNFPWKQMRLRKRLRKLMSTNARGLETSLCFFKLEEGNYCSTTFIYFRKKLTCKFSFFLLTLRASKTKLYNTFWAVFFKLKGCFDERAKVSTKAVNGINDKGAQNNAFCNYWWTKQSP